jgi:hypothetical protein
MPTPFTHLAIAERLETDPLLSERVRLLVGRHRALFWLGSVAADAHSEAGLRRQDTHFYTYDAPMLAAPWQAMLAQNPSLAHIEDEAHRVFVAAYLAHLAVDETWTLEVSGPYFARQTWTDRGNRFLMLNLLLVHMDERDRAVLSPRIGPALTEAVLPPNALPFLPDRAITAWNHVIYRQLMPGAPSETLPIIAPRVGRTAEALRALLDDPAMLDRDLWAYVPRTAWEAAERTMYTHAREVLAAYLNSSSSG